MQGLRKASEILANLVGVIGAVGIVVMMIHITVDVLARQLLDSALLGTNEIVSHYYMVAVAFLPLAWVENRNAMISVELIDGFMTRTTLRMADGLVALVSIGTLCLLTWTSWNEAVDVFSRAAFVMAIGIRIPVWPTYFFVPFGFGLAGLLVLFRLILLIASDKTACEIAKRAD